MPHLATDRVSRGLRWAGTGLFVLGVLEVVVAIGWTTTVNALVTASAVAVVAFGLPGAAAFGIALWLESQADRLEEMPDDGEALAELLPPVESNPFREPMRRYVVALVTVGLAWASRSALERIAPGQVPFILFLLAVMASGWFGGFGPAAVATLASFVVVWIYYLDDLAFISAPNFGRFVVIGLYLCACLGIAAISAALHAALARTQQLASELRRCRTLAPIVEPLESGQDQPPALPLR